MNLRFASGLTGLLIFMLIAAPANANTPEQIFTQGSPSVVVVDIFDAKGKSLGMGSGVVIGSGQVITNCHVAQKGKGLQVRQSGKTFKATLQYADPDRDLCQLSVPDLQATPVTLGTAKKLMVGQRVYAIGAPAGLELTLSEGLISSLRMYEGSQYIQTSAAISPGSSGGGLFDDQGRLIGITTFYLAAGQNLNFALPVDWISELPKRAHTTPPVAKKGGLDWLNRAAALEQKNDWQGLLKLTQQWVKSEQGSANAWMGMGEAYSGLKLYDQAVQAIREALRIQPEDADLWYNLGVTNGSGLNQHDRAIQAYREALRIQPEFAKAWSALGTSYYKLKQYKQAIQAYQEALRIEPENYAFWIGLGMTYFDIKYYDKAIQAFSAALRIKSEDAAFIWYTLGLCYANQGQRDKVREIYQTLRKLDPAMADRYFNQLILPH